MTNNALCDVMHRVSCFYGQKQAYHKKCVSIIVFYVSAAVITPLFLSSMQYYNGRVM